MEMFWYGIDFGETVERKRSGEKIFRKRTEGFWCESRNCINRKKKKA